jgi:2-hydroxychromene-2-carboxylate isomerase
VAAEKTVFGFGSPQAYVSKEQLENWKQAQWDATELVEMRPCSRRLQSQGMPYCVQWQIRSNHTADAPENSQACKRCACRNNVTYWDKGSAAGGTSLSVLSHPAAQDWQCSRGN